MNKKPLGVNATSTAFSTESDAPNQNQRNSQQQRRALSRALRIPSASPVPGSVMRRSLS